MGHVVQQCRQLDIGCGPHKQPGYLGIDKAPAEGVDVVVDVEKTLPFRDDWFTDIFSSHCLEHLVDPPKFFREIARVSTDGARVVLWTPYAFSNSGFFYGHVSHLTEDHYRHMCLCFQDTYKEWTDAYWEWRTLAYIVEKTTAVALCDNEIPLEFALRFYKEVAWEFGVELIVHKTVRPPATEPSRFVALCRQGPYYPLLPVARPSAIEAAHAIRILAGDTSSLNRP